MSIDALVASSSQQQDPARWWWTSKNWALEFCP